MEKTKLNEIFRSDYMAWGLAEFGTEQQGIGSSLEVENNLKSLS